MPSLDALDGIPVPPEVRCLIESAPLPGLDAKPTSLELRERMPDILSSQQWSGSLVEAGLWLLAGELERSHCISQEHGSSSGSYWHGIMHRREGDFGNARYWLGRVDRHPVLDELALLISRRQDFFHADLPWSELRDSGSLGEALINSCQAALFNKPQTQSELLQICWWEWQLLFAHCLLQES